jgi:hypothetical protein
VIERALVVGSGNTLEAGDRKVHTCAAELLRVSSRQFRYKLQKHTVSATLPAPDARHFAGP